MTQRTIKFRVWDKHTNKMVYDGFLVAPDGTRDYPESGWDWHGSNNDNLLLMQFTGLSDKNGKEMFEGDLVRYTISAPWNPEELVTVTSEIVWMDYQWWLNNEKGSDACGPLGEFGPLRVVGNVYENK